MDDDTYRTHRLAFKACCEDLGDYYHSKYEFPVTAEEVEEFRALTFFKGWEIYHAFDFFAFTTRNKHTSPRTNMSIINELFLKKMPALWVSPFKDRLVKIFSHNKVCMTFADFLDMMSAFSHRCPKVFKAEVVFMMYDFDEDGLISVGDLEELLRRLSDNDLEAQDYTAVAKFILERGDKDGDGYLSPSEFVQMVENSTHFSDMFHHTIRLVRDLRYF